MVEQTGLGAAAASHARGAMKMTTKKTATVAEYLTQLIDLSDKSQIEIANDLGYEKPNIITMFKQGRTKVPLTKVAPLAKSLGVDPVHMLRVVMHEYAPDTWEALNDIMGAGMVTKSEQRVLDIVRQVAGQRELAPETASEVAALKACVTEWKKRAGTVVSKKSDEPVRGRPKSAKTTA